MKAIKVSYLSATNTKGARIKAIDSDNNQLTMSRDYAIDFVDDARQVAEQFIKKMGWNVKISGQGGLKDCEVFTLENEVKS